MLAMNRIRFVPAQSAFGAFMLDLGGLEDGACQLQKQCHPHDHDEHRQQLPAGRCQGDIAKARRRERRYREIERINVADDASPFIKSQHEDERGGHENEDEQIHCGEDRILVTSEEHALAPQITQQVIRVDQPKPSEHAQECEILGDERSQQKGQHDDQIGNGVNARHLPAQVFGNPEPRREIQKYEQAKAGVDHCRNRCRGQRGSCDEIDDGQRIEDDQPISKPPGALALPGVEQPDRSAQFFHLRNMPQVFAREHVQKSGHSHEHVQGARSPNT